MSVFERCAVYGFDRRHPAQPPVFTRTTGGTELATWSAQEE
jgi:hypothetical protein